MAATAAAGAVVALLTAPAAHAEVVQVNYNCKSPLGEQSGVSPIDIKAVKSGSSYKITMTFESGVSKAPVDLPKGIMTPSALIKLGGAETGTVSVQGTPNSEAIPKDQPIKIEPMTGTYKPGATGKVTLTPSTLTISAAGTKTVCDPTNNPKPSLTLDVVDAGGSGGGSASGGGSSSSGGGSSSGGSGSLPKTGATDSAAALGTLGGTVLLVGAGGVLWVTRRRAAG
ncbi:LPXTG cell wall anchor domain-containing protein [Streptomyces sp. NPDC051940]|uniref:LPXTG cell wall anchor domain-containing protein n=1 Tax=Streptomyces sp. NPDC051940 TaxID=3155675 RepID=UPI003419FED9